ncbi:hypothetical protein pipiens_016496, partial [Culex pipiens pipiens]
MVPSAIIVYDRVFESYLKYVTLDGPEALNGATKSTATKWPRTTDTTRFFYPMHEDVKEVLVYFCSVIKGGAWPSEDEVAHLVDNDNLFMILYKELYYRHLHARIQGGPSLEQRLNSFYNYCNFFNYILPSKEPVQLELPDIWLWELIDEFVYQFQNFAQYRARLTDKSDEEMDMLLNNNSKVWNILCILNVLHSLMAGELDYSFYKMLGYFSLVGLLRVHSLLGDYHQAIKVLEPIELHKKSQYSHIPACQISTSYY